MPSCRCLLRCGGKVSEDKLDQTAANGAVSEGLLGVLKDRCEQLQTDLEQSEQRNEAAKLQHQAYEQEHSELQRRVDKQEAAQIAAQDEKLVLEQQNWNLQQDMEGLDQELEKQHKESEALRQQSEKEVRELRQRVQELEAAEVDREAEELNRKLDAAAENKDAADEAKELPALQEQSEKEAQELRQRVQELETAQEPDFSPILNTDASIELRELLQNSEAELLVAREELQKSKDGENLMFSQVSELERQCAVSETELTEAQETVLEQDAAIGDLKEIVRELETELAAEAVEKQWLEARVEAAAAAKEKAVADAESLVKELEDELDDMKAGKEQAVQASAKLLLQQTFTLILRGELAMKLMVWKVAAAEHGQLKQAAQTKFGQQVTSATVLKQAARAERKGAAEYRMLGLDTRIEELQKELLEEQNKCTVLEQEECSDCAEYVLKVEGLRKKLKDSYDDHAALAVETGTLHDALQQSQTDNAQQDWAAKREECSDCAEYEQKVEDLRKKLKDSYDDHAALAVETGTLHDALQQSKTDNAQQDLVAQQMKEELDELDTRLKQAEQGEMGALIAGLETSLHDAKQEYGEAHQASLLLTAEAEQLKESRIDAEQQAADCGKRLQEAQQQASKQQEAAAISTKKLKASLQYAAKRCAEEEDKQKVLVAEVKAQQQELKELRKRLLDDNSEEQVGRDEQQLAAEVARAAADILKHTEEEMDQLRTDSLKQAAVQREQLDQLAGDFQTAQKQLVASQQQQQNLQQQVQGQAVQLQDAAHKQLSDTDAYNDLKNQLQQAEDKLQQSLQNEMHKRSECSGLQAAMDKLNRDLGGDAYEKMLEQLGKAERSEKQLEKKVKSYKKETLQRESQCSKLREANERLQLQVHPPLTQQAVHC